MDTSVQLYEAYAGQSISYNPPFMSALLRWLGGGTVGTALLVLINTVLLYGSFAVVAGAIAQVRRDQGVAAIAKWQAGLAILVVLNPLIFLYAGIVWKDVLFASLMTSGSACVIAASTGTTFRRYLMALAGIVLFTAALVTRQQGIFMVPVLILAMIIALWPRGARAQFLVVGLVVGFFVLSLAVLQHQVDKAIKPPQNPATSVGFRNIMIFDLAGIVSNSDRGGSDYVFPATDEQLRAIRATYTPERIDTLDHTPFVQNWLGGLSTHDLRGAWWAMLKQNPGAYLTHRAAAYKKLLGIDGINGTLPIHVGVEGNPAYLAQVGIEPGRNQRTQLVYDIARFYFDTPLYRHAFWLALLILVSAAAIYANLPKRLLAIAGSISLATALMYASYLPTAIAADFRYLFGAIPLIMLLMFVVLLGWARHERKIVD